MRGEALATVAGASWRGDKAVNSAGVVETADDLVSRNSVEVSASVGMAARVAMGGPNVADPAVSEEESTLDVSPKDCIDASRLMEAASEEAMWSKDEGDWMLVGRRAFGGDAADEG